LSLLKSKQYTQRKLSQGSQVYFIPLFYLFMPPYAKYPVIFFVKPIPSCPYFLFSSANNFAPHFENIVKFIIIAELLEAYKKISKEKVDIKTEFDDLTQKYKVNLVI
jgi:hypothetical protein